MEQTNHPETRRLYDDNAYLNRFTANVLACTPAKKQGRFEVVLDQTAFFPEGGGRPTGAPWAGPMCWTCRPGRGSSPT